MASHDHLGAGSIFGADFRIVKPLSTGGMGAVYVVEQISTGKLRALKLLDPQLVADADLRGRFEEEARIGARIDSEHVVDVQTAGIDASSGIPFLVMELLEGEDLSTTVRRRGRLPAAEVFAIYKQLGDAMTAAHGAGIVHGGLKPENVFLARPTRPGAPFTVKVLDFGIASLLADPMWLAPEQSEGQSVGPAADVWALGLIAFQLLAGFPFWSETLVDPIPFASARAAQKGVTLPNGFDDWFARCVARDPAARFPNAGVAFVALAPLLQESSVLAPAPALAPAPPLTSQRGTASSNSSVSMTLVGGVAIVACLVVGGLIVRARFQPAAAPPPIAAATPAVTASVAASATDTTTQMPAATSATAAVPSAIGAPTTTAVIVDPNASLADQARTLMNGGDIEGARILLESRVFGGRANREESDVLREICKAQLDKACVATIDTSYPPPPAGPATVPKASTCGCPKDDLACMLTCASSKGRPRH